MNNDFQNHKRNDGVKWFVTLIALLLLAAFLTAAITGGFKNWNPYGWFDKKTEINKEGEIPLVGDSAAIDNVVSFDFTQSSYLKLSASAPRNGATNGETTVSQTLVATVVPNNAINTAVDWSVVWKSGTEHISEDVSDYVVVIPDSDGSRTASVVCKKAFGTDVISIICTTRAAGFVASCDVTYIGKPSTMYFNSTALTSTTVENNVTIYNLVAGQEYSIPLVLDNVFSDVTSRYTFSPVVTYNGMPTATSLTSGYVRFVLRSYPAAAGDVAVFDCNLDGTQAASPFTTDISINEFIGNSRDALEDVVNHYANVFTENGNLVIQALRPCEQLQKLKGYVGSRRPLNYDFYGYTSIGVPYLNVCVTDNTTGLQTWINIRVLSDITGVSLNSASLSF